MKISKKVREEAIRVLLCCADGRIAGRSTRTYDLSDGDIERFASYAWMAAYMATGWTPSEDNYLEAASLLRDGWNPGDPVYKLRGAK